MVLEKLPQVPDVTTGGLPTVAIRMPDNPIALELIRQCGYPVAAPSANISGRPSPTKGEHVVRDLMGKADIIIKSYDCKVGIESTVLDLTGPVPTILRPGILTPEQLGQTLGKDVVIHPDVLDQSTTHAGPNSGTPQAPIPTSSRPNPRHEIHSLRSESGNGHPAAPGKMWNRKSKE